MRTAAQAAVVLPPGVAGWVERANAEPGVRSVILYGSRAHGCARPDSDWDIAIVVYDGVEPSKALLAESYGFAPAHGASVIGESRWLEERSHYASFPNEVVAGVLLAGEDHQENAVPKESDSRVASGQYRGMFSTLWLDLLMGVVRLAECKASGHQQVEDDLPARSANAVEFVAKLVCLSEGVPFYAVHDLHGATAKLSGQWRSRLKSLNGDLPAHHQSRYGATLAIIEARGSDGGIERLYDRCRERAFGVLGILRDLARAPAPLAANELAELHRTLANPKTETMLRAGAEADEPDLCAEFLAVRDAWLQRLVRDIERVES